MVKVLDGGELPNWPDSPGVYVFSCTSPGESEHRLGAILYVGVSGLLRRRISYALGVEGQGAPHGAQGHSWSFRKREESPACSFVPFARTWMRMSSNAHCS